MDNYFFTVVIPTHNRSTLLKRAIESVLNQTFEDFEIIVVDDHSTDDTASIVSSYSDPRIRYMINNRTKGACGARNVGIFAAKGKWVAFLDDDDIWLPEKLESQCELARNVNEAVGLICTDYTICKEKKDNPVIFKNRPSGWIRDKLLYGGSLGCLSSVCVRTKVLRAIEGFDERFLSSQDWDLYLRITEVSAVAHVPQALVHVYHHNQNRIGKNARNMLEGHILLRKKYSASIDQSLHLRHRHESHIFTYAFLQNNRYLVAKCLPWVLLGIIIDLPNFFRTIRTTFLLMYRKKLEHVHT